MSEEYAHERKYVFSVLKLLFYQHGLRRLDLKARDPHEFWKKNLLVLVGDEFQDVVTSSVGGMSDYTASGKIREANVALIALTQSYLSLLPPHATRQRNTNSSLGNCDRCPFTTLCLSMLASPDNSRKFPSRC